MDRALRGDPGVDPPLRIPPVSSSRITFGLPRELGAETLTLAGESAPAETVRYAKKRNASKIVIGKPTHPALEGSARSVVPGDRGSLERRRGCLRHLRRRPPRWSPRMRSREAAEAPRRRAGLSRGGVRHRGGHGGLVEALRVDRARRRGHALPARHRRRGNALRVWPLDLRGGRGRPVVRFLLHPALFHVRGQRLPSLPHVRDHVPRRARHQQPHAEDPRPGRRRARARESNDESLLDEPRARRRRVDRRAPRGRGPPRRGRIRLPRDPPCPRRGRITRGRRPRGADVRARRERDGGRRVGLDARPLRGALDRHPSVRRGVLRAAPRGEDARRSHRHSSDGARALPRPEPGASPRHVHGADRGGHRARAAVRSGPAIPRADRDRAAPKLSPQLGIARPPHSARGDHRLRGDADRAGARRGHSSRAARYDSGGVAPAESPRPEPPRHDATPGRSAER